MYKNYQDLKVWAKAHEFVKEIYTTNFNFKNDEKFGLNSQIKRASVSIAANIAEGCSRQHNKEFRQFLFVSKGSVNEVSYYLLLCRDLNFICEDKYQKLNKKCIEIDKMLGSLIGKIKSS